jgi:hypothetical protein
MTAGFQKKPQATEATSLAKIANAAVDKQLDIHSVKCAKAATLQAHRFLSHNRPAWIPPFYSDFQIL